MDLDAQLEQFTVNLLGAPFGILLSHLFDKVDGLLGDAGFAALGFRFPFPVATEEVMMPSQEGLRLQNVEG